MKFINHTEVIDTGAAAPTNGDTVEIKENISLYIRIWEASGAIDDAIIALQCSPDGVVWDDEGTTWTFAAAENEKMSNNIPVASLFVRLQVTTKSTAASTANIAIQAK